MVKAQAVPVDQGMTLVEHLTELRKRLVICVLAVAVGMLVAFIAYPWIIDFLLHPYKQLVESRPETSLTGGQLLQTDPLEGFSVRMKISAYAGIALAMPVLLWQIWRFVTPGLYDHEKRWAVPFVVSALVLFVLGAMHGLLDPAQGPGLPGQHRRRRLRVRLHRPASTSS